VPAFLLLIKRQRAGIEFYRFITVKFFTV